MLRSEGSESKLKLWTRLAGIPALCLLGVVLVAAPRARAQGTSEFTLNATALSPQAIVPGGTASSSITLQPVNSFTGSVALGCTVTGNQSVVNSPPVCTVSPPSVTPPATATATITSTAQTTTIGYQVTITGTGPTTAFTTPPLGLTVLAVTPQFTITIQTAMSPTSIPAGTSSQGVLIITPVNGYMTSSQSPTAGVTLYCSSIKPLVTNPPYCSFSYPSGSTTLPLGIAPASSTLTIHANGPTVVGSIEKSSRFYGLWLSFPMLGFASLGAAISGKRSRKAFVLLAIFVLGASLMLLPACINNLANGTTVSPNGVTPANTYTFTIVGIDENGVVSSNSGTASPTMSLTVTAPK